MTIVPRPATGRVYETARTVRVADAAPDGRVRLDAVARFVQDIGNEDVADAGHDVNVPWVVRRSEVRAAGWPQLGERVAVATWCGGIGSRWAERRVSFTSASGTVDVATLVIHLDAAGRPAKLPDWFATYEEAAQGRTLSSRLELPAPPAGAVSRRWQLRFADLDVMGHVNNAVTWAAVEDECWHLGIEPVHALVEWSGALEAGDEIDVRSAPLDTAVGVWLCVDESVRVAARVSA